MKSSNPHSGIYEATTSRTLDLNGGNPSCNQGGIAIVEPIPYTMKIRSGCEGGGKGALVQTDKSATLSTLNDQYLFQPIKEQHLFENHSQDARYRGPLDVCPMLPAQLGTGGNNQPLVVESTTVAIEGNGSRPSHKGDGYAVSDVMYTLNTTEQHAVAFQTYQKVTGPLMANSHPGSYTGQDAFSDMLVAGAYQDKVGALCALDYKWVQQQQVEQDKLVVERTLPAYSMKSISRSGKPLEEQANPICASDYKDPDIVAYPPEGVRYIVRRLTPTECARLQGFPDAWGHPDVKEDLTDEEYQFWQNVRNTHAAINDKATKEYTKEQMLKWYNSLHTDSSEYKMWGNGIALPNALYVMQGIADVMESEQKAARKKWLDDLLGDCL